MYETRVSYLECEKRVEQDIVDMDGNMREEQRRLDPIKGHYESNFEQRMSKLNISEEEKERRKKIYLKTFK